MSKTIIYSTTPIKTPKAGWSGFFEKSTSLQIITKLQFLMMGFFGG
jgi:hypothetical protein